MYLLFHLASAHCPLALKKLTSIRSFQMLALRLHAISAPQAHAWLKVQPSPKLGLALMPNEVHVILKWWLGLLLTPDGTPCPLCHHNMDAWGHHMLTCRSGGDMITRHNLLRDCIADFCNKACLSPQIEKGSGILPKDNLDQQTS